MKQIIDFGELEKPIKNIEKVLKEYNQEEQDLILKHINQRHAMKKQKIQAAELSDSVISKIPLGGLLKKFGKDKE